MRTIAAVAAALLMSACWSSNSNDIAAPIHRAHAEREPRPVDVRFADSACSEDSPIGSPPGVLTWDGRTLLPSDLFNDAVGTIQELGEETPPELELTWRDSIVGGRYVRIELEGRTETLILRGVQSKLPFSVGDEVRYTYRSESSRGFGGPEFALALRASSGELLLQYSYLSDPEALEVPPGFDVDMSEEVCLQNHPCGSSIRAAVFQDAGGTSSRIEPGEARSFAGFDIYVYSNSMLPEDLSRRAQDCRANTIDLLLLRAGD
jgi:hypothetical protein